MYYTSFKDQNNVRIELLELGTLRVSYGSELEVAINQSSAPYQELSTRHSHEGKLHLVVFGEWDEFWINLVHSFNRGTFQHYNMLSCIWVQMLDYKFFLEQRPLNFIVKPIGELSSVKDAIYECHRFASENTDLSQAVKV